MLSHNGTIMPITALQQAGGNLIQMTHQYGNKQNKNVAIAASPQQQMQASQQQPQITLVASQLPTIIPNNQQPTILPNPGKSNEPRGKLAARNISNSVSPKVISQGTQQIQPKSPHILPQSVITSQQGLMAQQFKTLPQNSFITGQSPQGLNNQYFIQAFPGPTGPTILAPNNQHYLPRASNQSDMVIVAPNSFNTTPFYINQSGTAFVSSNSLSGTSVISVSSNNSHTATNTTQSGINKGQTCMIAPATQHTPTTNRYKNLKPAIVQSSIGTQTSTSAPSTTVSQTLTPIITHNHPTNNNSTTTSMNVSKGKSQKNIQSSTNKIPIEKQGSEARQTMTVTLIPQVNNPLAAQSISEKMISQDNSCNTSTMGTDPMGANKTDGSYQTPKAINDESKFAQNVPNKGQEKLKNKTVAARSVSNNALKEKMIQSPSRDVDGKKDAATGNDVGLMTPVISENNAPQDMNNLNNGRKKSTNGVARSNGAKSPQKAIVKPYLNEEVLTHVIDGFVIQESQSPFPINTEGSQEANSEGTIIASNEDDEKEDTIIMNDQMLGKNMSSEAAIAPLKSKNDAVCEYCGKSITKGNKKKKSKRFCSNICAKKFANNANIPSIVSTEDFESPDKNMNKFTVESNQDSKTDHSPNREPNLKKPKTDISPNRGNAEAPSESMDTNEGGFIPASGTNPNLWNVQDVYDFVRNLPGCQEYADEFKSQEIDGQALMLLKEDHLMSAMSMKLGPALKICSRINSLFRAEAAKAQQ
uniref:SAM domain-containing protein n=2 Tax=Tetranychus urticae TaxID=32264 RepID=T1KCK1_TETUR